VKAAPIGSNSKKLLEMKTKMANQGTPPPKPAPVVKKAKPTMIGKPKPKPTVVAKKPPVNLSSKNKPAEPAPAAPVAKKAGMAGIGGGIKLGGGVKAKLLAKKLKVATPVKEPEPEPEPEPEIPKVKPVKMDMNSLMASSAPPARPIIAKPKLPENKN